MLSDKALAVIEKLDLPLNLEEASEEELKSSIYALEDGEALKYMGFDDDNIPEIEEAYMALEKELLKR